MRSGLKGFKGKQSAGDCTLGEADEWMQDNQILRQGDQDKGDLRMGEGSLGGIIVCEQSRYTSEPRGLQGTDQSDLALSLGLDTGGTVTFVSSPGQSGARNSSGLLGLILLTDFMGNVVQRDSRGRGTLLQGEGGHPKPEAHTHQTD